MIDNRTIRLEEDSPGCVDTGLMNMSGISLPKFGEYSVELVIDDTPLASQPLYFLNTQ